MPLLSRHGWKRTVKIRAWMIGDKSVIIVSQTLNAEMDYMEQA